MCNIVDGIYKGYYIANFPLEFGSYLYKEKQVTYGYNQETARTILEQAGWKYNNKLWQKVQNYRTQKIRIEFMLMRSTYKFCVRVRNWEYEKSPVAERSRGFFIFMKKER